MGTENHCHWDSHPTRLALRQQAGTANTVSDTTINARLQRLESIIEELTSSSM